MLSDRDVLDGTDWENRSVAELRRDLKAASLCRLAFLAGLGRHRTAVAACAALEAAQAARKGEAAHA